MNRPPSIVDDVPYVKIMRSLGLEPDSWQVEVLESKQPRVLLNCSRQAGKSTVVAVLGLVSALFQPMSNIVLVSRSHRQSRELLRLMRFFYRLLGERMKQRNTADEIELSNLSRIVCVPCREDTIRGLAHVDMLIIDEAARVPDDLYRAVRPMLAVSKGRLICLSTPYGKRGFFWHAWAMEGDDWQRFEVPATRIPRIAPEFLEQEKRALGESWFRQEYCCSFEAMEGLVYPDFARCVVPVSACKIPEAALRGEMPGATSIQPVGGIDFGFRNPFAAEWGVLDHDDILWLIGEHYATQQPLSFHAAKLPRHVMWYADPAAANEIAELRRADFRIRRAKNMLATGISAVTARLRNGTLRILEGRCPKLLAEAGVYRNGEGENPIKEHDHALDALRYLIMGIDSSRLASGPGVAAKPETRPQPREKNPDDERYWARRS